MIYLFQGENSFTKTERFKKIAAGQQVNRYDGAELEVSDLVNILYGVSLFSAESIAVIDNLSDNQAVWSQLTEIINRPVDNNVIFLETKPDKRTKAYKALQKVAKVEDFLMLNDRQKPALIKWCIERAKQVHGVSISSHQAEGLIDRLGYDQLRLDNFLTQLEDVDAITDKKLAELLPIAKTESVFELFEAMLRGDREMIHRVIAFLDQDSGSEGAYMALGLLASQLMNLNGLVLARGDAAKVASDLGSNPFVVRKLAPLSRDISVQRLVKINQIFARADEQMKSTSVRPWTLVEIALVEAATLLKNK